MMSDCSSIRMQSTSCCLRSGFDMVSVKTRSKLYLTAPQIPCPHAGLLVDCIGESTLLLIQRRRRLAAPERQGPVLDARVDLGVHGAEHRRLQRRPAGDAAVRAHEHHVLPSHGVGERHALGAIANQHVGGAELLADIEHRHAGRDEGRVVKHRPHRHADQAERDHRRRMAVHDGHYIGPGLVDLAVDEALEEARPAAGVGWIAVEIVFDDVLGRHQGGCDRARHQVAAGGRRMPNRHVTEAVDDPLGGKDAAGGGQVGDQIGGHGNLAAKQYCTSGPVERRYAMRNRRSPLRAFSVHCAMAELKLKAVTRTQGNNQALKEGSVKPRGFALEFEEVNPLIDAFRRMVRGLEFDVCEMALTTYVCARAYGKRMTALPIFLVRAFHHGAVLHNAKSGLRNPKDLEGKRVGVNRGYTVTTGLWARSVLQHQYGVDLKKITWVLSGDEHVAEYRPPSNVMPIEQGKKMADMLASGELVAAIGVEIDHPDVTPLIPNALEAGLAAHRRNGHYPINHTVVIKDELLAAHPELAAEMFGAFAESKRLYIERLKEGRIEKPTEVDKVHSRVMEISGDPLPYGIGPNRKTLEELIQHATMQRIITKPVTVEELFARGTYDLMA